ncbi:MAG TPA: SIMPL domain-containing protein [Steroidobacteraceae bacterium]|nr:SIMPL domain-containing protein [Steroidobacteraceae bacterium]
MATRSSRSAEVANPFRSRAWRKSRSRRIARNGRCAFQVKGATIAEALGKLRQERPALDQFLAAAGFDAASLTESNESSEPNYEQVEGRNGNMRSVQEGYVARQSVTVNTADIGKIIAAARGIVQFEADGHPVSFGEPQFLVSNLEEVKMSLIAAAMQNSRTRAGEFAKNGDVEVGRMRSASQGAFYILAAGADQDVSDWGGSYDKSTVDKIARVVVTVDYGIE